VLRADLTAKPAASLTSDMSRVGSVDCKKIHSVSRLEVVQGDKTWVEFYVLFCVIDGVVFSYC